MSEHSIIIAVDPGASGGIAWAKQDTLNDSNTIRWRFFADAMPKTGGDILRLLRSIQQQAIISNSEVTMVIEKVGGYIGRPQPGSAMFRFGFGIGYIHGIAMTLGMRIIEVRPQKWQQHFSLGTKGEMTTSQWKNKLKAEAQRRFPTTAPTLKTADALLILDWAIETRGGER